MRLPMRIFLALDGMLISDLKWFNGVNFLFYASFSPGTVHQYFGRQKFHVNALISQFPGSWASVSENSVSRCLNEILILSDWTEHIDLRSDLIKKNPDRP